MRPRRSRGLAWVTTALVLAGTLAGCVSAGRVGTDVWTTLTPEQRAEADRFEAAMARMAAACRAEHHAPADDPQRRCVPPKTYVHRDGVRPHYTPATGLLSIPRNALVPALRPLLAHEAAHAWYADARDDCQGAAKAVACERNANLHGVHVLVVGYGYGEQEAVTAMWRMLVAAVRAGAAPSPGHPDPCAELKDFERRVGTTQPYACQERGGAS